MTVSAVSISSFFMTRRRLVMPEPREIISRLLRVASRLGELDQQPAHSLATFAPQRGRGTWSQRSDVVTGLP
jgi:hypothetical protein